MSTVSTPGRQSGSRAATLPSGRTSAASPGKSSSAAEPAWPASAIHSPSRCACRVASRRPDPLPPRQPAPPGGFVGAPPVQPGSGREQDQPGTGRRGGVEWRIGPRFGADGYPEPHPRVLEHGRFGRGGVGLFVLAKVPFALHADHPAGRGKHLGDEWLPARGTLGDPKAHTDTVLPDAPASLAMAGWSRDIGCSGLTVGFADPVSDISGNTINWQPTAAASATSSRWVARFPATSPFSQRIAASWQRTHHIVPLPAMTRQGGAVAGGAGQRVGWRLAVPFGWLCPSVGSALPLAVPFGWRCPVG